MAQIDPITGYISNIDRIRQAEYPTLRGIFLLYPRHCCTQLTSDQTRPILTMLEQLSMPNPLSMLSPSI